MTVQYIDPFGPPWKFQWLRLIFSWQGGIFQSFWLEWFIAILISTFAILIAYITTRNMQIEDWPDTLETLAEVVAFIGRRFQAAIGMMLGFYTSTMYGRWSGVRTKEEEVMRMINNIALRIAWSIKETPEEEQERKSGSGGTREQAIVEGQMMVNGSKKNIITDRRQQDFLSNSRSVRIELVRLLNLSHAIVVGQLYEDRNNEFSTLEKLKDCGLIKTKAEYDFLDAETCDYKFIAPLLWFQDRVRSLVKTKSFGYEPGKLNFEFAGMIIDLRGFLADLYMFRNQPVPLIYVQMVNVAVRLYMFMLLLDGIFFEIRKENDSGGLTTGSFWEILKYAFEYFLFVGWLTMSDAMGNPFRCWADQLEWEDFVKRICKSSLTVALAYGDSFEKLDSSKDEDQGNDTFVKTCQAWHPNYMWEPNDEQNTNKDETRRQVLTGF